MAEFKYASIIENINSKYVNIAKDIKRAQLILATYDISSGVDSFPLGTLINSALEKGSIKYSTLNLLYEKYGNPNFHIEQIFEMLGFNLTTKGRTHITIESNYTSNEILIIEKCYAEIQDSQL
jgi:hypothetical protein